MMKTLSILFVFILFIFSAGCKKLDLEVDVPSCIEKKIKKIRREEVRNPPAKVWKWEVDGLTYYYIRADCCDQLSILYDGDCNRICAPDGGHTGAGDGKCPEFKEKIKTTLVWEDDRT